MKKGSLLAIFLALALILSACGSAKTEPSSDQQTEQSSEATSNDANEREDSTESNSESAPETASNESYDVKEMSTAGTIEETLIYDDNGVKITATNLKYSSSRIDLSLELENTSDKDLQVTSATMGYSCNAVNGYMFSGGYINAQMSAGKKASETAHFSIDELLMLGITEVASIEMSFTISDDDNNYVYTDPVMIKTSLYENHDNDNESFSAAIKDASLIEQYGGSVDFYSEECLFDQNGIRMLTEALMTNSNDERQLVLEFENTSEDILYVTADNIAINGLMASRGTWTNETVIGGHKVILSISLDSILNKDCAAIMGMSEIGSIGMDIVVKDRDYDTIGNASPITVTWASGTYDSSGEEVYSANNIRIVYKGACQDESSYSPDIYFYFIAENNGSEEIRIDDVYDSFSVNDYMVDCYYYSTTISAGEATILKIELPDYYFDDAHINSLDDIANAEITFEIRGPHYSEIDNPTISFNVE